MQVFLIPAALSGCGKGLQLLKIPWRKPVQTCSRCFTQSLDDIQICPGCGAELAEFSKTSQALKRFTENPRVLLVKLTVSHDACPACAQARGSFQKNEVPKLPVEGCSHPQGCRCFYEPVLSEIFP
jgi:hypothetical protein